MTKGNVNLSGMVGPSDQQPYSHLPFGSSLLMANPGGPSLQFQHSLLSNQNAKISTTDGPPSASKGLHAFRGVQAQNQHAEVYSSSAASQFA